tara:strand:- start:8714 stop:8995 length:282 start_codon:yes stop_codon:yes gene_type:complete
MRYSVYLIVSLASKRKLISYVGYTSNLKQRLSLHNKSKGAKFTRGRKWYLAYSMKYANKSKAMKEEYKLKKNIKKRNNIKNSFLKKKNETNKF